MTDTLEDFSLKPARDTMRVCVQVASEGKMCILSVDVTRALTVAVPKALKVYLNPGAGLAQAVRAGLPPGTKEPQVQQAIQVATAEADKAKVSGSNQLPHCCSTHSSAFLCHAIQHAQ